MHLPLGGNQAILLAASIESSSWTYIVRTTETMRSILRWCQFTDTKSNKGPLYCIRDPLSA